MDDAVLGTRNKRGDWTPAKRAEYPPVFVWPARPRAFLKWVFGWPGYLFPWNFLYAAVAVVLWLYLTPSPAVTQHFAPGWVLYLLARNAVLVFVFFGGLHLRLYVQKKQGTRFKFNGRWPATDNSAFLFRNQTIDNMIWTFGSAVPVWTAYEALTLWMYANGYLPQVSFAEHPVYCIALMLLIPVVRDLHFYLIHRLIHAHALYHSVHKLHHNNVNPGPWSGLAMHPVEHLLYFSVVLVTWVVPGNALVAIFNLTHTALAPAPGHAGFERIEVGEHAAIETHCYQHYLHHKLFECNYADGVIPLDKWFGTFHDGSAEAEERMNARFMARAAAQRARREARQAA